MSNSLAPASTLNLKLYFLQGSRAIRIAWLLEELNISYENVFFERGSNKLAPPDFKSKSGSTLGKSPVLWDGELMLTESGAITEYILEKYSPSHKLFGNGDAAKKEEIRKFIHASEGTLMVHILAIPFSRWFAPQSTPAEKEGLRKQEQGIAAMVWRDLDWLEDVLSECEASEVKEAGRYLVGYELSAADTMVLFCVQLIFRRGFCGGKGVGEWPNVERWVERCEGREGWKRTVERTGFVL